MNTIELKKRTGALLFIRDSNGTMKASEPEIRTGDNADLITNDDVRVSVKVTNICGDRYTGTISGFDSGDSEYNGYKKGDDIYFYEREVHGIAHAK